MHKYDLHIKQLNPHGLQSQGKDWLAKHCLGGRQQHSLFSPGDQALLSLLVPRQWLTLITGIYYPIFKAGKNYLLPQTTATVFWN